MEYYNPEISITEACRILARRGENVLPRTTYVRYVTDGILDAPVRMKGRRPYHTIGQLSEACARLRARSEKVDEVKTESVPVGKVSWHARKHFGVK